MPIANTNVSSGLLSVLSDTFGREVAGEDVFAYVAAVVAHSGFTARFLDDLSTPGLRLPITADERVFSQAVELGRLVAWLHTFGERFANSAAGRPSSPPRLDSSSAPSIPAAGAIPSTSGSLPDDLGYDEAARRLYIGEGYVDGVPPEVWNYQISGVHVLRHWFSYRKANRERPIIGDRRPPSRLGEIQPDHWLPEYTTELIDVLHVLGWLVKLEPAQAALLDQICSGPLISEEELRAAGALQPQDAGTRKKARDPSDEQTSLL